MKFSEMKYERPMIGEIREKGEKIREAFVNAERFEECDRALMEWDRMIAHVDTMMSLAYVRNSINTADPFYEAEVEYIDEISPLFTDIQQSFAKLLTESAFRQELAAKYGELMFLNNEIFLKAYSDKIIPEMQECNKLETAYQKLLASAQIEFEGETLTLSQLMPYKKTSDDAKRRAAWAAEAAFYSSVGDQLDDIYDQLVTLRTKMAKKIGYENFVPLG